MEGTASDQVVIEDLAREKKVEKKKTESLERSHGPSHTLLSNMPTKP